MKSKSYQIGVRIALAESTMVKEGFFPLAALTPWLMSAGAGAAIGGGLNAMSAKPGDRLGAFGRGAMWGAVGGTAGKAIGMGLKGLQGMQGVKEMGGVAGKVMNSKWTPRVGDMGAQMAMPTGQKPFKPDPQPMTNLPWMY